MIFYTAQELRTNPESILGSLSSEGEAVITDNGRSTAILLGIGDGGFEKMIKAVRQAKATVAFKSMRAKTAVCEYMSEEDIAVARK
jgi:hypothetical protein